MSSKTKTKIGMLDLGFAPITAEPANAIPTYSEALSLGHAVRAALTVTMAQLRVYGDDALQISADLFTSGHLDTEALLDDLALEAALYGSTEGSNSSGVTDGGDDAPPRGRCTTSRS